MTLHDATEQAYKNGYEAGKRDAMKQGRQADRYVESVPGTAKGTVPKHLLDKAISAERGYWNGGGGRFDYVIDLCKQIQIKTGVDWLCWQDLIGAIIHPTGLKPDATNEDIYAVLHLLGWEVKD